MNTSPFEASQVRADRDRMRGRRVAFSDHRTGGGYDARTARDLAHEAKTSRDREFWNGYAIAMTQFGKR